MKDNEIIKALKCCTGYDCENCEALKYCDYMHPGALARAALDLINRQKAEILELQKRIINRRADMDYRPDKIKSEAIKEFAERLKNCFAISGDYLDIINIIDNLIKEMEDKNV